MQSVKSLIFILQIEEKLVESYS